MIILTLQFGSFTFSCNVKMFSSKMLNYHVIYDHFTLGLDALWWWQEFC